MADDAMSKSAKRRAAKKNRDATAEEVAAPPEPEVKKAEPAPKAKAKAKAEPAPPAAEPKAKGKAKAAPKAAAAEPAPAAPKAAAEPKPKADAKKKADGKAAAKPKAKPKKEEEEESKPAAAPEKTNDFSATFIDDGKGGDWEVSSGKSKKQEKQKQKAEEKKIYESQVPKTAGGKAVPGATNLVPGMAGYKAGPSVDQSLMATPDQIAKIMATKAPATEEKPKEASSVVEVKVPEDKVAIIIGTKGGTINMIKEKTDVKNINLEGGILRIEGKPEAVAQAEAAVQELLTRGYTSLAYENFKSDTLKVNTSALPDIIGKEGKIIIAIKDTLKVDISMPKHSGPPGSGPKRTMVTIAGKAENVEKAKEVVNDIVMYYHHEITHPGEVHEELEIEEWNYRFIIGKAGSELRHIEKNYKVRVRIPREDTPNKNVVVVGEKRNVERGRDYIYNALEKANEPKGRGAADKADDHWGEDGDIDQEAARYLYKRA